MAGSENRKSVNILHGENKYARNTGTDNIKQTILSRGGGLGSCSVPGSGSADLRGEGAVDEKVHGGVLTRKVMGRCRHQLVCLQSIIVMP